MTGTWWACPECGYVADTTDHVQGSDQEPSPVATPKTGDVTLCLACAQPGIFVRSPLGRLHVRQLESTERAELLTDPRITGAMAAIVAAKSCRPRTR